MIWCGAALGVTFLIWWFWLSSPSTATIDALRQGFLEGPDVARSRLEAIPKRFRLDALYPVMRDLLMDDHHGAARLAITEVAAIDAVAATAHAEMLAGVTGDTDFAVDICEKALGDHPNSVSALGSLARVLGSADRLDEALAVLERRPDEPDLLVVRADLLQRAGRLDEALAIANALEGFGAQHRNRLLDAEELQRADHLREFGASLRREVHTELDPDFDPLQDLAVSGQLKPRSGANHWVIGLRMREDQVPSEATLGEPVSMGRRAFSVLEQFPDDRAALCEAGEAQVRTRDPARAAAHFDRAVQRDPTDFLAQLGLGAALRCSEERWLSRLGGLPEANVPCPQHFPDLAALTEDERRVVTASVGELATLLDVDIRIRPLAHVPSDGEVFVDAADLLDLDPVGGWRLARLVAQLCFEKLPEASHLALVTLMDEARARPGTAIQTELDELPELFAEAWVRHLCVRWLDEPADALSMGLRTVLS